jgi:hypothetical protein
VTLPRQTGPSGKFENHLEADYNEEDAETVDKWLLFNILRSTIVQVGSKHHRSIPSHKRPFLRKVDFPECPLSDQPPQAIVGKRDLFAWLATQQAREC